MHHLILLHGMGEPDPVHRAYGPFTKQLHAAILQRGGLPDETVRFHHIDYSEVAEKAKREVWKRSFPALGSDMPPAIQLIPFIRYFVTFFIGDVIIYASAEGESNIRSHVFGELDKVIRSEAATFSIVAHSLGSIIAYDYLYHLFGRLPEEKRHKVREDGMHRLRHFFTMGSPIGLFLLRKLALVRAEGSELLANPIGLDPLRGHWYNFYDNQDILAYPLKNYFPMIVEDVQVQTGDLIYN
ncbi:MAG: hypothetical protein ACRDGA_11325, partial [Bacteroidota bacterium]